MLRLVKVAVTGSLSCGKSLVCHFLKEFGAYVVNADAIVHKILSPETILGQKVIETLGSDVINHGKFDRRKIAEKVFNSPSLLKSLEHILHPEVVFEIERQYKELEKTNEYSLFVAEIPLLFEIGQQKFYDFTIVVSAEDSVCRKRFIESTGLSDEDYSKRMARQWPLEKKIALADFVIHNNESPIELKEEVRTCLKSMIG